ncbi:UDP-N-acetylmuramoyl-tripeptide--D-alanyl-D-alanine ligase [Pseudocalidococcus azoricus]
MGMTPFATPTQLLNILSPLDATAENFELIAPPASHPTVSTDTRTLQPGDIFLALRGETFDGHGFVQVAKQQGASLAIVDQAMTTPIPQIVVQDTLAAYQILGQWWRQQFQIPVIAITGSVGKTTTKELIAAALGCYGKVLKTEANYNNEIGVPKTLLQLTDDHDFAVIEMGMRGPGEIALLSRVAQATVGVITNVGTAHIGRLGSREAIAQAKCELLAQLPKTSTAILNGEQPLLLAMAEKVWAEKTITYGLETGKLRGTLLPDNQIEINGQVFPLPLPGRHNALNFLATIAVTQALGLDLMPLQSGITVQLPPGRAKRYTLETDIVLLDETYNAGLESMLASLQILAETPGTRRIAVLGPMRELGDYAVALHQEVGARVKDLQLDQLLILDTEAEGQALAQGATPIPTQQFSQHQDLIEHLKTIIGPGDRLLFKASHSVGLDRVVKALRESGD